MKTRIDVLNHIVETKKVKRYLEIGVQLGVSIDGVKCDYKIGVDPAPLSVPTLNEFYKTTSDKYFEGAIEKGEKFDLVFIDGLHEHKQVYRDIENAFQCLNKGGVIVCHDMLPDNLEYTKPTWCGDAYKALIDLITQQPLVNITLIEDDHGCAILTKGRKKKEPVEFVSYDYEWYIKNKHLFNCMSFDQYVNE